MPLNQRDHGDVSWADMSEGWPETNEHAYEKWVFCNKSKIVPYGSYVLISRDKNKLTPYLRVESQKLLETLNENFNIVRDVILGKRFS